MVQAARKVENMTEDDKKAFRDEKKKEKKLDKQLDATFPASDPLSVTQPGGGITGPDDI